MKNYYEILEVDKHASQEIIEKAYKTLVKKYHPDLQPDEKKIEYEQKIKLINDAYDTLSDSNKRILYDKQLENNFIEVEKYNSILGENIRLKKELNNIKNNINSFNNYENNSSNLNNSTQKTNYKKTYKKVDNSNCNYNYDYNTNQEYENDPISNFFYTIKHLLKNLFALIISFAIILILLKIPFLKNLLLNLTGTNGLIILGIILFFLYFISKK